MLSKNFTYFSILNATNHLLTIGQLFPNITTGCYYGTIEISQLATLYATSITNLGVLSFNAFFNSGTILICVRNLVLYFYRRDYTPVKNAYLFGTYIGMIFWYVFYPAQMYIETTLSNGGNFQYDWTWNNIIK